MEEALVEGAKDAKVAGAPVSNTSSDDGRVPAPRRRTIRVPCKARGVPAVHNARNAFIEVPPDVVHGAVLICSHPICAGSGRKFRYCAECELPVAKRNFNKRHTHGDTLPRRVQGGRPPIVEESDDEDEASLTASHHAIDVSRSHSSRRFKDDDDRQESDPERVGSMPQSHACPSILLKRKNQQDTESVNLAHAPSRVASAGTSAMTGLNGKEAAWLSLLHARPEPSDALALQKWFETVLELSEGGASTNPIDALKGAQPDTPTSSRDANSPGRKSSGEGRGAPPSDDLFVNGVYPW